MNYQNTYHRSHPVKLSPKIRLLDNTLRDGEQTPGIVFNQADKIAIVSNLYKSGVRDAEIGFPASSAQERDSIRAVIELGLPMRLYGLCRLKCDDIDFAVACGLNYITLFLPGSHQYRLENLGIKAGEEIATIQKLVGYAVSKRCKVKFSCENSSRMPFEDMIAYLNAAKGYGAEVVSFADTAGVMTPLAMFHVVKEMIAALQMDISIHCHNDLGMATANTIAAAEAGAVELQGCVNGIGERAGNTPLEEIAIILATQYSCDMGIDFKKLKQLSSLVYELSNLSPAFNKPLFGRVVFQHESAIHVASILRQNKLYEAYPPEMIGRENEIMLGKHSGLATIAYFLAQRGIELEKAQQKQLLSHLKKMAELKIGITFDDLLAQLDCIDEKETV